MAFDYKSKYTPKETSEMKKLKEQIRKKLKNQKPSSRFMNGPEGGPTTFKTK